MKKIFSIITLLVLVCKLSAQSYQLPLKDLTSDFAKIHRQTDKKSDFYSRLSEAAIIFFSSDNQLFSSSVANLAKDLKINIDSSAGLIFETVMDNYIQNHLWDEDSIVLEQNIELFTYYSGKICPCLTERIKSDFNGMLDPKKVNDCAVQLSMDTGYMNTMRKIAGSKTMNQIFDIAQYAGLHALQHCSALRHYFIGLIHSSSVEYYVFKVKNTLTTADYVIATLYKKNDIPGLMALFPDYKKFESQIKQINILLSKGRFSILPKQEITASGSLNFTKTYYIYQNKKPVIIGQTIYTIKELLPNAPVLSIKYNSPDKIVNKKAIYEELEGADGIAVPIQPPRESPPGVKIVEIVPKKD